MEGQLAWRKWHPIADGLQVALETTLPAGAIAEYKGSVLGIMEMPDNMIYRAKSMPSRIAGQPDSKETVDRHYHPRIGSFPDLQSSVRKITFKVHIKNGLFKRISFRRHVGELGTSKMMWCGRKSESNAFGFSTKGSRNPHFVTLAYPGKTPEFEHLFIKVSEPREPMPYYLKVEVRDEGENVIVTVTEVEKKNVPLFLTKEY